MNETERWCSFPTKFIHTESILFLVSQYKVFNSQSPAIIRPYSTCLLNLIKITISSYVLIVHPLIELIKLPKWATRLLADPS